MKYRVNVSFEVETSEYHEVGNSPEQVRDLARDMLFRQADLPEDVMIDVAPEPGMDNRALQLLELHQLTRIADILELQFR